MYNGFLHRGCLALKMRNSDKILIRKRKYLWSSVYRQTVALANIVVLWFCYNSTINNLRSIFQMTEQTDTCLVERAGKLAWLWAKGSVERGRERRLLNLVTPNISQPNWAAGSWFSVALKTNSVQQQQQWDQHEEALQCAPLWASSQGQRPGHLKKTEDRGNLNLEKRFWKGLNKETPWIQLYRKQIKDIQVS